MNEDSKRKNNTHTQNSFILKRDKVEKPSEREWGRDEEEKNE